jgi:thioredoxin reductase
LSKHTEVEYLIIGAGPAGLQLGYFFEKGHQEYLILERGERPGTFFEKFPRHRTLISVNKVFTGYEDEEVNLRWDWNSLLSDDKEMQFKHYSKKFFPSADVLVRYLGDFANRFAIKVNYGTTVCKIDKKIDQQEAFLVQDQQGDTYTCHHLIIATGFTQSYIPLIPGIELCENYADCSMLPEDFTDQRVLIIGKGNSAFETANNLIENAKTIHICSPVPITMAWKTHYVGNLRAVNDNFLDTYQLKLQNGILDANIESIVQQDKRFVVNIVYTHARNERRTVEYDRILVCTGFRFDAAIFTDACRPALTIKDRLPAMTSRWESSNIKDLYFIGTLMQTRDFKKTMSGFIHGFRYNIQALHHIFEDKYEGKPWPAQVVSEQPEAFAEKVLQRINSGSSMFLQPGFFCDVLVVPPHNAPQYYNDIPVDYLHDSALGSNASYYTISLEYGDFSRVDPFNVDRDPDPDQAHLTPYIHPIIRHFSGASLIDEYHLPEDLENVYEPAKYSKGLIDYLKKAHKETTLS